MGYFLIFIVSALLGFVCGDFVGRYRTEAHFDEVIKGKDEDLEAVVQNMKTTRDAILRDARVVVARAQEYVDQDEQEMKYMAQVQLARARDIVETARSLATESIDRSRIDSLSKYLKNAEERASRNPTSAKEDIARVLSDIDSMTGKKSSSPRPPTPAKSPAPAAQNPATTPQSPSPSPQNPTAAPQRK
jgi:vacuolar-type H+-ATPase subunit H